MSSAKIIFKEHDNSSYVSAFDGVYGGMVHPAVKGKVGTPILTTSESNFVDQRGKPNPKHGSFAYDAFAFHTQSNKFWSVRVTHTNAAVDANGYPIREDASIPSEIRFKGEARYSAVLVRAIVADANMTNPNAEYLDESMVVKPFALGMVQDEVDAFNFPEYVGTREYSETAYVGEVKYQKGKKVYLTTTSGITEGDMFGTAQGFGLLNSEMYGSTQVYTVESVGVDKNEYHVLTLNSTISANEGDILQYNDGTNWVPYNGRPYVLRAANNTNQIIVSSSDLVIDGTQVMFGTGEAPTAIVSGKDVVAMDEAYITTDVEMIFSDSSWSLFQVTHYEIEQRDALLVLCESQGVWGNKISIGIEKSKNYDSAFNLVVYENGAEVDRHNDCSRVSQIDGLNQQMFVEDKVNGKSAYIHVISNPLMDETVPPLETKATFWRENPLDIFVNSGITTAETVNSSDMYVAVSGSLPLGTRIKFGTYSDEYKVSDIVNGQLVLDRPFIPAKIPVGTTVNKYSYTENKVITKLEGSKAGVVIGATYSVGTKIGKILDAGANFLSGGDDGSSVTVYDLMMGVDELANREKIQMSLLMDGGFAHPALAQKLVQVAEKREDCFVYLSTDPAAEASRNYVNDIIAYRNSLNLNSSSASLFSGWVEVADPYNQKNVWISPVGFAMAAQSYTANNFDMWYPAAGWVRGGFKALRVKRAFDEAERDILVSNQINPIRYKDGAGLSIWGNETLLSLPSVLQSRHVRMLIIVIKQGLRNYLEGKHYDLNTERGRSMIEAAINAYMRDVIGDGVYGYTVAVEGYTTQTDITNKKVKVFLGIQPTLEMKEFQVDLTLFSANQKIEVI